MKISETVKSELDVLIHDENLEPMEKARKCMAVVADADDDEKKAVLRYLRSELLGTGKHEDPSISIDGHDYYVEPPPDAVIRFKRRAHAQIITSPSLEVEHGQHGEGISPEQMCKMLLCDLLESISYLLNFAHPGESIKNSELVAMIFPPDFLAVGLEDSTDPKDWVDVSRYASDFAAALMRFASAMTDGIEESRQKKAARLKNLS